MRREVSIPLMPFYSPVAKFCTSLFPSSYEQPIETSSDAEGVKSQVTRTNRENQLKQYIHMLLMIYTVLTDPLQGYLQSCTRL